jgi:hypothetical protein
LERGSGYSGRLRAQRQCGMAGGRLMHGGGGSYLPAAKSGC